MSIATALRTAAEIVDAARPRSKQRVLGASDIGPCIRKAGYIFRRRPETDTDERTRMAAILGTWIHDGALHALEQVVGIHVETLVQHPSGQIRGHVDGIEIEHDEVNGVVRVTVEDLKTRADDRMLDRVRLLGPPEDELRQVYTYVWLLQAYGARVDWRRKNRRKQKALADLGPLTVDTVRIRYLARDRGEEYIWESPVDPVRVEEAADRYEWVATREPEDLPREQDGPGLSFVCDGCPFRTACWGGDEVVDDVWPQSIRIIEGSTTIEEQITEYLRGMALASEGDRLKKSARATLSATPPGQYGNAGVLGWTGGRPKPPAPDVDRMVQILKKAGVEIPTKDGGTTNRSISVRPPKG